MLFIASKTKMDIQVAIKNLLAAQEPCSLGEIVGECSVQCDIKTSQLLPSVMQAIADLTRSGEICEYPQLPLDDPFDYAWQLSEEATLTNAELETALQFGYELIKALDSGHLDSSLFDSVEVEPVRLNMPGF